MLCCVSTVCGRESNYWGGCTPLGSTVISGVGIVVVEEEVA